jgi:hypothetical protein
MPITIKDSQDGIANIITASGTITDEGLLDVFTKHFTQDIEKFGKYRYSIVDYTAVTEVRLTNQTIEQIAELSIRASGNNQEILVAFVANTDLTFGLVRMADSFMYETNWEQEVFRDRQEAEDWIMKRAKERFGIEEIAFG